MNRTNYSDINKSQLQSSLTGGQPDNGIPPLPDLPRNVPLKPSSAPEQNKKNKPKQNKTEKKKPGKPKPAKPKAYKGESPVRYWFLTFMCMNIPLVGWIYLFYLAYSKKNTDRRSFARAYLLYKLVFFIITAIILGVLIYIGLDLFDQLLAYMEML